MFVFVCVSYGMNGEEVLENVVCARAHNSEQQMELLADSAALMCDSRYVFGTKTSSTTTATVTTTASSTSTVTVTFIFITTSLFTPWTEHRLFIFINDMS